MKNKFKINFKKPNHGWLCFDISSNKTPMIYVSSSGVFNPYWDYVNVLYNIKYGRKNQTTWIIDQEGYDAEIIFKVKGIYVEVITKTLTDRPRDKHNLKDKKEVFLKKQLVKEMKNSLLKLWKKNKREMNNDWYPFTFNYGKLHRI